MTAFSRSLSTLVMSCLLLAISAGGSVAASPPATEMVAQSDVLHSALFARMLRVNEGLISYQSRVHLAVAMQSFPYLSPTLDGTVYYQRPDQNAIIFDSAPALAPLFQRVFPRLDPPASWPSRYSITLLAQRPESTTLRLVPRKNGRVDHLDIVIDEHTAMPIAYTYTYREGGTVHFDQAIQRIGSAYVVSSLVGQVALPSFRATANAGFTEYRLNTPIPASVFQGAR